MSPGWLVVGASGLVGAEVMRALPAGEALGVAREVRGAATRRLDLLDAAALAATLAEARPEVVVLASAFSHVDGCELDPARSERENVQGVRNLLDAVGGAPRVVFFSTDHVFDGAAEAYDEGAAVNPLGVYARHKRAVEELLLARGRSLVVRTSYVFGVEARRKNFLYRVLEAAEQGRPLVVPARQAGMPTWARWLAESTVGLARAGLEGLVHLVGPELLTKAEWARLLARGLGLGPLVVEEVSPADAGQVAPRPERVRLRSTRHALRHPPLLEALARVRAELAGAAP